MLLLNQQCLDDKSWYLELTRLLPDVTIQLFPEVFDKELVEYALLWDHPPNDLKNYPNLKAILLLGAGVDHLSEKASLPDVPIIRLSDPAIARDMAQYVLYWIMNFQRQYDQYRAHQKTTTWKEYVYKDNADFKVGIMGMGYIGKRIYTCVQNNEYTVCGWNRSPKEGYEIYTGNEAIPDFLGSIDVLVLVLPLSKATYKIVDASFLAHMKPGSYLINVGRGALINQDALIAALKNGRIASAALDVTYPEPLPEESELWKLAHITPHISGMTYARSAAKVVAGNIIHLMKGETVYPIFDRKKGY